MKGFCKKCSRRESCIDLCATAEDYVNKDVRPIGIELGVENINNFSTPMEWGTTTSEYRLVYCLYFLDKKIVSEIAYHVLYSRQQIYNIINSLKEIPEDLPEEEIKILKMHFIDGKNVEAISKDLNAWFPRIYRIIRKHIDRNESRQYVKKSQL